MVRFRILGPLAVEDDGAAAAIGGPKSRAILAVLLVRRGTVVSTDRLTDALWGDHPPTGAVSSIRAYISRLRPIIGGGDRLAYRAPGYVLSLAPGDELDVVEFERHVAAARRAADPSLGLVHLDAALGLWRGDALAEFADLDVVAAEADRLTGLRLCVTEERIDALLVLGRAVEVVAELESMVRQNPNRERPVVQLMRALYASGRQSDALARYHELRHRLDEDLAVEPSEQAQSLYRAILNHDAGLTGERPRGNLPRRLTSFVGRKRDVDAVATAVTHGPLVTLTGVGGVGKSRLAIEVAGLERDRFPDGVWVCELAALSDGRLVTHAIAAVLHVQQRHESSVEDALAEYLGPRTLLLVLDNCEHVIREASSLVDKLLRRCPGLTVLATSREALGLDGEQVWPVQPLTIADAIGLFVQRARAGRPAFDPSREAAGAVDEICRRLDGLPLGIELAAARTRVMSAAEVLRRWDGGSILSGGVRTAATRHQSLAAAVDWSYRLLAPSEQRLFIRLSVFAGTFDLDAVHGVCAEPGESERGTLESLTGLCDKSMVTSLTEPRRSRYRLLETLRAAGRERLQRTDAGGQLGRRHADYFIGLAERAARGLQGPDEADWVEQVLPDVDNLRAAFDDAISDSDTDRALRLVTSLPELMYARVGVELHEWTDRVVDRAPSGHALFAAAAGTAARAAWAAGDYVTVRHLAARAAGRVPGPGAARMSYPADVLADVALYEGDVDAALLHYEGEVNRARGAQDWLRLSWTLHYVAIGYAVRRTPQHGLAAAREGVEVADRTGNPTARSMTRYALGLVLKKSDPGVALTHFAEAAQLAASVRNFWWHDIATMESAATMSVHGDPVRAAAAFLDVLERWDRVGDWTQQWLNLRYVVRLLLRLGADEEAVVLHHCLLAAGKPSPLGLAHLATLLDGAAGPRSAAAALRGSTLARSDAIQLARTCLRRYR